MDNEARYSKITDEGIFDGAGERDEVILADRTAFRITEESTVQSRWRSPALWVALTGLLGTLGFATGLFARLGITDEVWAAVGTFVSAALAAFGIANNPTDSKNF